jgi:16S rRNA A1518/A1519 N6-dimethyltransferase RsmA/KsgA/DIM1 with predicted DNA glycosylase/AP lyase activity
MLNNKHRIYFLIYKVIYKITSSVFEKALKTKQKWHNIHICIQYELRSTMQPIKKNQQQPASAQIIDKTKMTTTMTADKMLKD